MKYNTIKEGVGSRGETLFIVFTIEGDRIIYEERFTSEPEAVAWCESSTTRYIEERAFPSLAASGLARKWNKKRAEAFKAKQRRSA